MKHYHAMDVFVRQRIRNGHLFLLYVAIFFAILMSSALALVYGNIFYLQLGVNVYLPFYVATYVTLLLWMRIQLKRLPSMVDAVVLRRLLKIQMLLCAVLAMIAFPLHLTIIEGYAERGSDIPYRILLTELIGYIFLLICSLIQILSLWKSEKWPTSIRDDEDMEHGVQELTS